MSVPYGKIKDTELLTPFQVDANGVIYVSDPPADPVSEMYGQYGGAWQKAGLPFSPSGSVAKFWANYNLPAGASTVNSVVVPAGEAWILSTFYMLYEGTTGTSMFTQFYLNGIAATVYREQPPINGKLYDKQIPVVLFPGDYVITQIVNATLNDNLHGGLVGYTMDLDL